MIEIRNSDDSVYKTEEFKNKISKIVQGENNPNYGNYWSDEQKHSLSEKMKEDMKGRTIQITEIIGLKNRKTILEN